MYWDMPQHRQKRGFRGRRGRLQVARSSSWGTGRVDELYQSQTFRDWSLFEAATQKHKVWPMSRTRYSAVVEEHLQGWDKVWVTVTHLKDHVQDIPGGVSLDHLWCPAFNMPVMGTGRRLQNPVFHKPCVHRLCTCQFTNTD